MKLGAEVTQTNIFTLPLHACTTDPHQNYSGMEEEAECPTGRTLAIHSYQDIGNGMVFFREEPGIIFLKT